MKRKIILIVSTGLLASLGVTTFFVTVPELASTYIAVSSLMLCAVTVGGIQQYNSLEMQDTRDILENLREKNKDLRQQVRCLEESLIQCEKELVKYAYNKATAGTVEIERNAAVRTDY